MEFVSGGVAGGFVVGVLLGVVVGVGGCEAKQMFSHPSFAMYSYSFVIAFASCICDRHTLAFLGLRPV